MLARGRYGVEYFPKPEPSGSGGAGGIVLLVVVLALGSLSWTLYKRYRNRPPEEESAADPPVSEVVVASPEQLTVVTNVPSATDHAVPRVPVAQPPARAIVTLPQYVRDSLPDRPTKIRNLLERLERAEKLEMAATTLEVLREQPQASDMDDWMASELGRINLRRLSERNAKWVREVVAKRGDSATRIASDHNCTLASLRLLNGSRIDRIRIGDRLFVLSNPAFTLVVDRRARTADLKLGSQFFKRYALVKPVPASVGKGLYKTEKSTVATLRELGVAVSNDDQKELELLMPKGSSVTIPEG